MYEIFDFLSNNFETIITIFGSVVVGASAACALLPGGGLVKKILAVLALNIRNATPEQIAKAKALVDAGKELTKPEKKEVK